MRAGNEPWSRSSQALLMAATLWVTMGAPSRAQQSSTPRLYGRSQAYDANSSSAPASDNAATRGDSALPPDVSGEYHFDHVNESIEIDIVHGKLSGYITRLGDAETDKDTPLTYFFDKTSVDGTRIAFQTRVVHGLWYGFRGTIVRGDGQTRDDEGYYVLHGVLAQHHPTDSDEKSADETVEERTVNYKSMGR